MKSKPKKSARKKTLLEKKIDKCKDGILIANLRKALLFYAENSKYQSGGRFSRPDIMSDRGQVACEALGIEWPYTG